MESTLMVVAWVGGVVSGVALTVGVIALVTGHLVLNPRRVDWSVGEGRLLGAILAGEGLFVSTATLVTVLQMAINLSAPPVMLPLTPIVGVGGLLGIFAVGRRHDARNPSKRYWP